jgi:hypothetical protein
MIARRSRRRLRLRLSTLTLGPGVFWGIVLILVGTLGAVFPKNVTVAHAPQFACRDRSGPVAAATSESTDGQHDRTGWSDTVLVNRLITDSSKAAFSY